MNRCAALLVLACLPSFSGCADGLTEMVVTVDTDGSFVAEEVSLVVDGEPIGAEIVTRRSSELPLVVSIVHREGSYGPIVLSARGTDVRGNEYFAEARAFFVPQARTSAALTLSSECGRCASGESCVGGRCTPVVFNAMDAGGMSVPDSSTEQDAGGMDAGGMDAGGMDAGGMDAGRMDAGGMDAGHDAGGMDAGGMCSLPCGDDCRCRGDECGSCDFSCAVGEECKARCDNMCSVIGTDADKVEVECRADCTVSGEGADEIKVECSRGSRCDVDCRGTDKCRVDCKGDDDECTLRCDEGADCEFNNCDDAVTCGGVQYCQIDGACDE